MTPDDAHDGPLGTRSIGAGERSGVLNPSNLDRYGARWFAPDPAIGAVVETFWSVRWRLNPGELISQRIIASPAVNLTVERGDVPAPLIVTGVYRRAWMRPINGSGEVFAIRLRPAGLAVLSDLSPDRIADTTAPATDFRAAVGTTPGAYVRSLRALSAGSVYLVYLAYTYLVTATTIKVPSELRDRLNAEARRENTTVAGVLQGLLAERERAERFRAIREAMSSASPQVLADYEREADDWDPTLTDGLDAPVP